MDTIKWLIIGNFLYGLLYFFLGLPLLLRKVPRNDLYGVRTRAALESDQRWYDINAYYGRHHVIWSVLIVSNSLTGFFLPSATSDAYLAESLVVVVVAMAVPIILVLRWSRGH